MHLTTLTTWSYTPWYYHRVWSSDRGILLVKLKRNGKLSSALFWISPRNASVFHFSRAIKQPTFHMNIPRLLCSFMLSFFLLLLLPSSGGSWGLWPHGPPFWCWKDSCHKNEWTCSPTLGWWEKQTLHWKKPPSAFGQPWMWSIGFPIFNFHCADCSAAVWGILSCFAVQVSLRGGRF